VQDISEKKTERRTFIDSISSREYAFDLIHCRFVFEEIMSQIDNDDTTTTTKKQKTVLNPALLQSITKAFSQSIPTVNSPSDQLAKLSVHTPTSAKSDTQDIPQLTANEPTETVDEHSPTVLMVLKQEFQLPTPTPRRSSNFLKGCKW